LELRVVEQKTKNKHTWPRFSFVVVAILCNSKCKIWIWKYWAEVFIAVEKQSKAMEAKECKEEYCLVKQSNAQ